MSGPESETTTGESLQADAPAVVEVKPPLSGGPHNQQR